MKKLEYGTMLSCKITASQRELMENLSEKYAVSMSEIARMLMDKGIEAIHTENLNDK